MRLFKDFDIIFLVLVMFVAVLGLFTLYSGAHTAGGIAFQRQLIWVSIGLFFLFLFSRVPLRFWQSMAPILYVISLFLLVAVLFTTTGGARRWLHIGGLSIQPSEFAKISTVLFLADILSIRKFRLKYLRSFLIPFLICLPPFLLVLIQPDLGTSLVFLFIFLVLIFYKGTRPIFIFLLLSPLFSLITAFHWGAWIAWLCILFGVIYWGRIPLNEGALVFGVNVLIGLLNPFVWQTLRPYQRARIIGFLSPSSDTGGIGWQLLQSRIAIGSGGFLGKGFLEGTQERLNFLPQAHTDFAFSAYAEELGFLGAFILILAFVLIILRGINIASQSRNQFASLFVFGLISIVFFQAVVNLGMTMGLFPVVGLPLPFLSYGGSSTLIFFSIAGLILGAGKQRYQY